MELLEQPHAPNRMYHVSIQFSSMRGRLTDSDREKIARVADHLSRLLHQHDAGLISRVKRRSGEPATLRLDVSEKSFVEEEIMGVLDRIGVLDEAKVFYEGPDKRSVRASH
jgi:hypothetical protein